MFSNLSGLISAKDKLNICKNNVIILTCYKYKVFLVMKEVLFFLVNYLLFTEVLALAFFAISKQDPITGRASFFNVLVFDDLFGVCLSGWK